MMRQTWNDDSRQPSHAENLQNLLHIVNIGACPRNLEPNSALGGAISYLLKHWEKLTLFLRVPGSRWITTFASKH